MKRKRESDERRVKRSCLHNSYSDLRHAESLWHVEKNNEGITHEQRRGETPGPSESARRKHSAKGIGSRRSDHDRSKSGGQPTSIMHKNARSRVRIRHSEQSAKKDSNSHVRAQVSPRTRWKHSSTIDEDFQVSCTSVSRSFQQSADEGFRWSDRSKGSPAASAKLPSRTRRCSPTFDILRKHPNWSKIDAVSCGTMKASAKPQTVGTSGSSGKQENEANDESRKRRKKGGSCLIGYEELEKMAAQSENEILLNLISPDSGFNELLDNIGTDRKVIALSIVVLGKACMSVHRCNVISLVNSVVQNNQFMFITLQKYLASFKSENNEAIHLDSLVKLLDFFRCYQECMPSSASEFLCVFLPLVEERCREAFSADESALKSAEDKLSEMKVQKDRFLNRFSVEQVQKISEVELANVKQPSQSYVDISVLPTQQDMVLCNPFLRPNIVIGRYSDAQHYLDVQFRLLREDYVRPMREGINWYNSEKKEPLMRNPDVKVYRNVSIVEVKEFQDEVVHEAHLDKRNLTKVDWERSKRLLRGSLLCLSSDEFQTTYFASVADRNCEKLRRGVLLLHFEEPSGNTVDVAQKTFVMLETSAYFEAYRHNLAALQDMSGRKFPFKKYIVDVQSTVDVPEYLQPFTVYDMRPLLSHDKQPLLLPPSSDPKKRSLILRNEKTVKVSNFDEWPAKDELRMDESQYAALRSAITKEFAVIQGPPGTGKTFVGLKIAELLLHNSSKWKSDLESAPPILVVCYTNHALDQFLEGILMFAGNIVRVGGRCRNINLRKYQLVNRRRSTHPPNFIVTKMSAVERTIRNLKNALADIEKEIENANRCVISEDVLGPFMKCEHFDCLKYQAIMRIPFCRDDGYLVLDWLGIRGIEVGDEFRYERVYDDQDEITSLNPSLEHFFNDKNTKWDDAIHSGSINSPQSFESTSDGAGKEVHGQLEEAIREIDLEFCNNFPYSEDENDVRNNDFDFNFRGEWNVEGSNECRSKYMREQLRKNKAMSEQEVECINSIYFLSSEDKWRLYEYWVEKYIEAKQKECFRLRERILRETEKHQDIKLENDLWILNNSRVVGVTTTGAAKYRKLLFGVKAKIVIVEEAAEILESHVVTSFPENTQHLILIGDHQQLKPNPTVYELALKFNLNVSLFERMINNGMDYCQLKLQHRMRPCISSLLVPTIYPNLLDDDSVKDFENIKGVSKNMFFVTHEFNEKQIYDSSSRSNQHEAEFMIKLCEYFLQQGYSPSQITILTTYSGQMFALKRLPKTEACRAVRITIVDNFQGEENDIILISFVRSNEEGNIGFLKVSNRVCVALSRAKMGLFCIGNFKLFAKKSDLWKNILVALEDHQAIGPALRLQCQNHGDTFTEVSKASDFSEVIDGTCSRPCEYRLTCGHVCTRKCHIHDSDHTEFQCLKDCEKTECELDHKCPKRCYEWCGPCNVLVKKSLPSCSHDSLVPCRIPAEHFACNLPCARLLPCGHECRKLCYQICSPCEVMVKKLIPSCNHEAFMPCYKPTEKYLCTKPCSKAMPCGHKCQKLCYQNCNPCKTTIEKLMSKCNHKAFIPCYIPEEKFPCPEPCEKIMPCGHKCKNLCRKDCGPCEELIEKLIPTCNHGVTVPCHKPVESISCRRRCQRTLPCGHKCRLNCGEACSSSACFESVIVDLECSHKMKVKCRDSHLKYDLIAKCGEPCGGRLQCGHKCSGSCGKCMQGRIHVACMQPCRRTLLCGHACRAPCSSCCPPCQKVCERRCPHDVCRSICGRPWYICTEPCEWRCWHQTCTNPCGLRCNREPCNEPCPKTLRCGHVCHGFCGEPCPPLCIVCHRVQLKDTVLHISNNVRLILLEDCGHVFEVGNITRWMNKRNDNVIRKKCPKCNTVILHNFRFENIIKSCFLYFEDLKRNAFVDEGKNVNQRNLFRKMKMWTYKSGCILLKPCFEWFNRKRTPFLVSEILRCKSVMEIAEKFAMLQPRFTLKKLLREASGRGITYPPKLRSFYEATVESIERAIRNRCLSADEQFAYNVMCEITRLRLLIKVFNFLNDLGNPIGEREDVLLEIIERLCKLGPFLDQEAKINELCGSVKSEAKSCVDKITLV